MHLSRNWWMFLLRGIFALIFGVAAVFFPWAAFLSLVFVFGIFAMANGIVALISTFSANAKSEGWWWLILEGAFGVLIGLLTLVQPAAMAQAMLWVIGAWALVTGIFEIVTAIRLRKLIEGELWLILAGLASVIFGVLVFIFPGSGAFAIGLVVGVYMIIFGVTLIALALRLRSHNKTHHGAA